MTLRRRAAQAEDHGPGSEGRTSRGRLPAGKPRGRARQRAGAVASAHAVGVEDVRDGVVEITEQIHRVTLHDLLEDALEAW